MNNTYRWKKILNYFFVLSATTFLVVRGYNYLTDDFRLGNITYELPYHPEWKITSPSAEKEKELVEIFEQPFRYLTKGAQSYVFSSDDGKYVIKFFKFKHLRPSYLIDMLPNIGFIGSYKTKQTARKERKLAGVFQSHIIAYNNLRQESGLVFLQMNTKQNTSRFITIFDKMGFKHTIDLQSYPFVLQKRGISLQETLNALLKEGNVSIAKQKIDQIFALFAKEYALGIYDDDHGIYRNTGFLDNNAVHLDVGELIADESLKKPAFAKKEALYIGKKLKTWIQTNHKIYAKTLSKQIDKSIETHITHDDEQ